MRCHHLVAAVERELGAGEEQLVRVRIQNDLLRRKAQPGRQGDERRAIMAGVAIDPRRPAGLNRRCSRPLGDPFHRSGVRLWLD